MNKTTTLILSAVVTFGVGAGAIFGNGIVASKAMSSGIKNESPVIMPVGNHDTPRNINGIETVTASDMNMIDSDGTYTLGSNEAVFQGVDEDGVTTVLRTLESGETVLVQYYHDETDDNSMRAVVTRTSQNGASRVENYEGVEAVSAIRWYITSSSKPSLRYVDGLPGDNDIDEETAVGTAKAALTETFALKPELLARYTITAKFYTIYEDTTTPGITEPIWWINLYPTNVNDFSEIGCYTAILDADTGEVIDLLTAADGKG